MKKFLEGAAGEKPTKKPETEITGGQEGEKSLETREGVFLDVSNCFL